MGFDDSNSATPARRAVTVLKKIGDLLTARGQSRECAMEENLLSSGRLDSLAVVELMLFLEEVFAIDFSKVHFNPRDFESPAQILKLIGREGDST